MINVIKESGIVSPVIRFKMLNGKCDRLSDSAGSVIDITGYMLLERDKGGDIVTVLDILTDDGRVMGTNSATVRETFEAMCDSFGEPTEETPLRSVVITSKESAKGRTFLDFDFAE